MNFGAWLGACLEVSGMSVGSEPTSARAMFELPPPKRLHIGLIGFSAMKMRDVPVIVEKGGAALLALSL